MLVCLFDIDGTLISSGGAGKAALETALTSVFGLQPRTEALVFSGRTDRAITRDLFHMHGLEDTPENRRRLLEAYLGHLPDCLRNGRGRVLPGIAALLERLSTRNDVALGLLTGNIRHGASAKLGHFDLSRYFSFGGYGDEHLERDQVAHEALAEVQRRFNRTVAAEHIWVIGDTPLDIRCARAIGARVAAVGTGWHPLDELAAGQPDLLFADLSDPGPLLERWGLS